MHFIFGSVIDFSDISGAFLGLNSSNNLLDSAKFSQDCSHLSQVSPQSKDERKEEDMEAIPTPQPHIPHQVRDFKVVE